MGPGPDGDAGPTGDPDAGPGMDAGPCAALEPLRVTEDAAEDSDPSLLGRAGGDYLIAFMSGRTGNYEIFVAHVLVGAPAARVARTSQISNAAGLSELPTLLPIDDTTSAVIWADDRSGNGDVYVRTVGADGAPIGSERGWVATAAPERGPSATVAGAEIAAAYQVDDLTGTDVWMAIGDVETVRMTRVVVDSPMRATSPQLAWDGTRFGVAWLDDRSGATEIRFRRVDGALEAVGTEIVVGPAIMPEQPAVIGAAGTFVVLWRELTVPTRVLGRVIDGATGTLGPPIVVSPGGREGVHPTGVGLGPTFLVGWSDRRTGNLDPFIAQYDGLGMLVGGDVNAGAIPENGQLPCVATAAAGSRIGVAWMQNVGTNFEIYLSQICPGG